MVWPWLIKPVYSFLIFPSVALPKGILSVLLAWLSPDGGAKSLNGHCPATVKGSLGIKVRMGFNYFPGSQPIIEYY